jgi:FKBP-type peptidyl-prolyl cis-trans isomerase
MREESMKWLAVLTVGLLAAPGGGAEPGALKTPQDTNSYAIGADLARNLRRQGIQVESEALLSGMRDVFAGGKLVMTEDDLRETLRALQAEQRRKVILTRTGSAVVAEENAAKGAAFLAQNQTNQGVMSLPSGLQYKILKTGGGPKPAETDTIECRFRGTFIDGQEFTGIDPAGKPATFKMSEVIPGWKETLLLMPVGSKWQLFIPPQLAYGEQGAGRARIAAKIGPNTTLVYELELLGIN